MVTGCSWRAVCPLPGTRRSSMSFVLERLGSVELDQHGLMVGGLRLLIDAHRLHSRCQVDGDEDEIAVLLRLVGRFLFVDLEGRGMPLGRMRDLPRVRERRRAVVE